MAELSEERSGIFAPCINSFPILVKPLFRLSHEREGRQTEPNILGCDVFDDDGVAQFNEVL
jgi:hypothetical protein